MPVRKSKNPTVNTYLKDLDGSQKDIVLTLRELVLSTDAGISEDIKWKNCLTFIYNGKNIIQTVVGKNHTTFIFFDGAKLKDHRKMLFGDGKAVRSARFSSTEIDGKAVQDFVRQEIALHQ